MEFVVKSENISTGERSDNIFKINDIITCFGDCNTYLDDLTKLKESLSEKERLRMDKFFFDGDKNCYLVVHALLRRQLAEKFNENILSTEITYSENSKPFISNLDIDFNISHSGHFFAYAIAENNRISVGIDIEMVKEKTDILSISSRYFSEAEHEYISQSSIDLAEQLYRFYEIWTRKEAFLKMIGIGLFADLSEFSVTPGKNVFNLELSEYHKISNFNVTVWTKRFKDFVLSVSFSEQLVQT